MKLKKNQLNVSGGGSSITSNEHIDVVYVRHKTELDLQGSADNVTIVENATRDMVPGFLRNIFDVEASNDNLKDATTAQNFWEEK